jgi:riboflavin kinase/FMN adenylyltransferase
MNKEIPGIANIGFKPTVGGEELCLEIHLLNFDQDIYLKYINVEFLDYLRDEQKFNDLSELKNQLKVDREKAIQYFSNI